MAYTDIDDPSAYFQTTLYSGTGSEQSITNTGNSDLQPDWVWLKVRSNGTYGHALFDSVRGVNKVIGSNTTNAEEDQSSNPSLSAFNSDGFTVGGYYNNVNQSGQTFVSWQWKAGTSFTNDASATGIGDIDSSGSVNTDAGFSVITATSDGAANKDIAHGLGAVPDVIFAKNLERGYNWDCYFKTLGYNASLQLNTTAAVRTGAWGSNTFTTTTFETLEDYSSKSGEKYVYYCFAEKQGYSKFGSYTGNGSTDGPFSFCSFRPAFVMIKQATDASTPWFIFDTKRNPGNKADLKINPNSINAESAANEIDILSNGFKLRTSGSYNNGSGKTMIFMAFAENPFVTSTGVPATAR